MNIVTVTLLHDSKTQISQQIETRALASQGNSVLASDLTCATLNFSFNLPSKMTFYESGK